jgi:hypothetical protein
MQARLAYRFCGVPSVISRIIEEYREVLKGNKRYFYGLRGIEKYFDVFRSI